MSRYTIGGYKHSATLFKGIQESNFNAGLEQMLLSGSGAADPTHVSVGKAQPEFTFGAVAVKTILGQLGILGAAMASDKVWFQKMADAGLRAGASSHLQVTMAAGMLIPVQISVSLHKEAVISCRAVPTSSDGSASPLAIIATGTLEVGQDQIDEAYMLGAVSINGTELESVDGITLDFGLEPDILFKNGRPYPYKVGILTRQPSITITTHDMDKFASWTEIGVAQGITDSTVQLIDQVAGGARGTNPITFTVDEGMIHFDSFGGSQRQRASGSVKITPVSDGVAGIIAVTGI